MSEFTVVSEMIASLDFSGGDVPTPYWVKKEKGEEISLSEDEFVLLFESKEEDKAYYVRIEDGRNRYITKEEFYDLYHKYWGPEKLMEIEIVRFG